MVNDPREPLVFKQLSSAEMIRASAINHPEWGSGLTLDQYHLREAFCSNFQIIKGYGLLLNEEIVAALEVYLRPGTLNNDPKEVWCIASVFVPPQHRHKGFATKLLKHLEVEMDRIGAISVLFSAVKYFYNQFGYKTFECDAYIYTGKMYENYSDSTELKLGDLPTISEINKVHFKSSQFKITDNTTIFSFPYARELFYKCIKVNPHVSLDELKATSDFQCNLRNMAKNTNEDCFSFKSSHDVMPIRVDMTIGTYFVIDSFNFGYILWTMTTHKKDFSDQSIQDIQSYNHLAILGIHTTSQNEETGIELESILLQNAQHFAFLNHLSHIVLWTKEFPDLTNAKLSDSWPAIRPATLEWRDCMQYTWC